MRQRVADGLPATIYRQESWWATRSPGDAEIRRSYFLLQFLMNSPNTQSSRVADPDQVRFGLVPATS